MTDRAVVGRMHHAMYAMTGLHSVWNVALRRVSVYRSVGEATGLSGHSNPLFISH
jgi:hypothetical protein